MLPTSGDTQQIRISSCDWKQPPGLQLRFSSRPWLPCWLAPSSQPPAMAAALGTSAGNVCEVVPGRLTYAIVLPRRVAGALIYPPLPEDTATALYYPMEEFCLYYPFFLDYGPVPLNRLYRFCSKLQGLLATGRHVVLVSGSHAQRRANSTYLIAAHGLLFRG